MLGGRCDPEEVRLRKYLLDDYDSATRPVEKFSLPLLVVFNLSLHHIIDVVSYELGKLTFSLFLISVVFSVTNLSFLASLRMSKNLIGITHKELDNS